MLDIAIPVYNEEADLERNVGRLRRFLDERFPFPSQVTIVDNASTDATWPIAQRLALNLPGVRAQRLAEKGRGRAVRHAWLGSRAPVVAYMDVDLSTNLNALLPLVAPLISGHSDLAIGSRLATGARTVRSPKRELISRCYNVLLHAVLGTKVKDAQCGFKAMRADVACDLLPAVQDQDWFFDTELLVQAQRAGLRIHEVPVDWIEDPDTRVEIVPTAIEDLRGVWRLSSALRSFAVIGLISTIAYILCFGALRMFLPAAIANAVSQLLTAVANTAANRRFTFLGSGNGAAARDHLGGLAAFGVALGLTSAAIAGLHFLDPVASPRTELTVLVTVNLIATAVRFLLLRAWIAPATKVEAKAAWSLNRRIA